MCDADALIGKLLEVMNTTKRDKKVIVSAVDSSVAQTECKNSQTVFAVLAENSV